MNEKKILITVLMPVYNSEKYLNEAINSILGQTFTNFEFLIINDGSTDNSQKILESYRDPRIHFIKNEKNMGLVFCLNKGIELAQGKFIARMDADDISLPTRLKKQIDFLRTHPSVCAVSVKALLINKDGNPISVWDDDFKTSTYEQIRENLPKNNCIVHPGILINTKVLKKYKFNKIYAAEDYELWLRLIADGYIIEKLDELLYKYRMHKASITSVSNKKNIHKKMAKTKLSFLMENIIHSKLNLFTIRVFLYMCYDFFMYTSINIIQSTIGALISFGQNISFILKIDKKTNIFIFFPFYHIGGAEKVHTDIIECISDRKAYVFITRKSNNDKFKYLFEKNGKLVDISHFTEKHRILYYIYVGIIAKKINKHKDAIVFGSNSLFFYTLLNYLDNNVRTIDLIHAFGGGIENIAINFVEKLDLRITINDKTLNDLKEQYVSNEINEKYIERIKLIENQVYLPTSFPKKDFFQKKLKIIYIGRGSEEKRVHLIAQAAKSCKEQQIPVEFMFVGNVIDILGKDYKEWCNYIGEVSDLKEIQRLYENANILVLTSSREGFPLVIMEAMAFGVVPISTAVGGIPYHIKNRENGMLITDKKEEEIVKSLIKNLKLLSDDRELLMNLANNAYNYASKRFSKEKFCAHYRNIFTLPGKI